jgi:hypothetical protein
VTEPTETEPAPASAAQAQPFAVVCASCRRKRTLADDYDYNPLQLVTGRPLGWYNGEDEQLCGQCLTATMRGQAP